MDFLKGSSSSSPVDPDIETKKLAIKNQVRNEIALLGAQELLEKINDNCYDKCITKPSTSLSSSEETCLSRCMERYMEAFNIVSKTYIDRITRERSTARAMSMNNSPDMPQ